MNAMRFYKKSSNILFTEVTFPTKYDAAVITMIVQKLLYNVLEIKRDNVQCNSRNKKKQWCLVLGTRLCTIQFATNILVV